MIARFTNITHWPRERWRDAEIAEAAVQRSGSVWRWLSTESDPRKPVAEHVLAGELPGITAERANLDCNRHVELDLTHRSVHFGAGFLDRAHHRGKGLLARWKEVRESEPPAPPRFKPRGAIVTRWYSGCGQRLK